jgi:hypothetical protein
VNKSVNIKKLEKKFLVVDDDQECKVNAISCRQDPSLQRDGETNTPAPRGRLIFRKIPPEHVYNDLRGIGLPAGLRNYTVVQGTPCTPDDYLNNYS